MKFERSQKVRIFFERGVEEIVSFDHEVCSVQTLKFKYLFFAIYFQLRWHSKLPKTSRERILFRFFQATDKKRRQNLSSKMQFKLSKNIIFSLVILAFNTDICTFFVFCITNSNIILDQNL
jgi:serine protease inhibitor